MTPEETTTLTLLANQAADAAIRQHIDLCPLTREDLTERLRKMEINYARLTGMMIGSGLLGGAGGAALIRLLTL